MRPLEGNSARMRELNIYLVQYQTEAGGRTDHCTTLNDVGQRSEYISQGKGATVRQAKGLHKINK